MPSTARCACTRAPPRPVVRLELRRREDFARQPAQLTLRGRSSGDLVDELNGCALSDGAEPLRPVLTRALAGWRLGPIPTQEV
jgi:hypothetical protein